MSLAYRQITLPKKKARARYLTATRHMEKIELPAWLSAHLEQKILPLLVWVGFDRGIAHNLFKISANAWKSLEPLLEDKIMLHPAMRNDIAEILQGIVTTAEKKTRKLTALKKINSQELFHATRKAMRPDSLFDLLHNIPATWITLPRAHSFLARDDSLFLVVYLRQLDRETNLAFKQTLARILIEFIGNYSLKYINSALPEKKMVDAIFYGYVTMFWKNLRQPPHEFEDLLVFKNFLSWAKAFKRRDEHNDTEKYDALTQMEEIENSLFPSVNSIGKAEENYRDIQRFRITLRHGNPGIKYVVNYFTVNHLSCPSFLEEVCILLGELKKNYVFESSRSKEFINKFLLELKTVSSSSSPLTISSGQSYGDHLAFTRNPLTKMVDNFSATLH